MSERHLSLGKTSADRFVAGTLALAALLGVAIGLAYQPAATAATPDIVYLGSGHEGGFATNGVPNQTIRTFTTSTTFTTPSIPTGLYGAVTITLAIHDKRWAASTVSFGSLSVGAAARTVNSCQACTAPVPATEIWGVQVGGTSPSGTVTVTITSNDGTLPDPEIVVGWALWDDVDQFNPFANGGSAEGNGVTGISAVAAGALQSRHAGVSILCINNTANQTVALTNASGNLETAIWSPLSTSVGGIGGIIAASSIMASLSTPFYYINSAWTVSTNSNMSLSDLQIRPFGSPTAVRFGSFRALQGADGVRLRWRTGAEMSNLGFNLYREQDGVRTLVNRSLVAGSAFLVGPRTELSQGRGYEWADPTPADASVRYWLEAIDVNGEKAVLGPVFAERTHEALTQDGGYSRAAVLDSIGRGAAEETAQPGIPAGVEVDDAPSVVAAGGKAPVSTNGWGAASRQWDLANGDAAKIGVTQEGWYSVSRASLVAAGFDPGNDSKRLQLYADGVEVPIVVKTSGNSANAQVSSIEFYGTPNDTPYSGKHVYWLIRGSVSGERVGSANSNRSGAKQPTSFLFAAERKDRTIYFAALTNNGDASNFFGPVVSATQLDQTITVASLDRTSTSASAWTSASTSTSASLQVVLQGVTTSIQHTVDVLVNGRKVGTASFKDQANANKTFQVPISTLVEGTNTVSFVARGGSSDVSLVDRFRLTYPHQYTADGNALKLTVAGGTALTLSGFADSSVRIIDVSDPTDLAELDVKTTGSAGAYKAAATAPGSGTRSLLAFGASRVLTPASIVANKASSLHDDRGRYDLVIVTNAAFSSAAATLKSQRQAQGLSVATVDVEDVYDEYNFGHKSPYAIQSYLQDRSSQGTKYVVLVGDATIDPRNYLGLGDFDLVPTKLIPTSLLKTASDDWFVDSDGNGLPEMAIGRLAVRTATEAANVVGKLKTFDQNLSSSDAWRKKVLQVADQDDPLNVNTFSFEKGVGALGALVPSGYSVQNVLAGQVGQSAAHTSIVSGINAGALMTTFVGHGTQDSWSKLHVFDQADAALLTNGSKLPLVVTMDCLNGLFIDVYADSLAEALQKAPNGGAAAVWASSALTNPEPQGEMATALYKALFGSASVRLGDAMKTAKAGTTDPDARKTWILFGDPTMKLR